MLAVGLQQLRLPANRGVNSGQERQQWFSAPVAHLQQHLHRPRLHNVVGEGRGHHSAEGVTVWGHRPPLLLGIGFGLLVVGKR